MKKAQSLGDRMKKYENVNRNYLMRNSCVILRIDGKAFSTFTKGLDKPFDYRLIEAMEETTKLVMQEMSGAKLAYLQSDEISILITDTDTIQTQGRFDYNINKINSVTASLFTGFFNKIYGGNKIAFFDCRCFNIPDADIANYFLRRQKDWYRNSIQMYARSMFKQKELQGKKLTDIFDMIYEKGAKKWENLPDVAKNGTYIYDGDSDYSVKTTFSEISELVSILLYKT